MSVSVRLGEDAAAVGAAVEAEAEGVAAAGACALGARISNIRGRALLNLGTASTATDPRIRASLHREAIPGIVDVML